MSIRLIAFLGWSSWSEWTLCNMDAERSRFRKCLTTNPSSKECQGNEREVRQCDSPVSNGKLVAFFRYYYFQTPKRMLNSCIGGV